MRPSAASLEVARGVELLIGGLWRKPEELSQTPNLRAPEKGGVDHPA
jgi:hypothetical protein